MYYIKQIDFYDDKDKIDQNKLKANNKTS